MPAQFTFRNINRLPRDRDRWFELQGRVACEPAFSHRNDPELFWSKTLADRVAGGDLFELVEVSGAGRGIIVEALKLRLIPPVPCTTASRTPNLIAHERQQSLVEELIGRAKNPLCGDKIRSMLGSSALFIVRRALPLIFFINVNYLTPRD
jgi:hypothetical protein